MHQTLFGRLPKTLIILVSAWILMEIAVRIYLEWPLSTDFYSSLPADQIPEYQKQIGVRATTGKGWIHLGWIADPEREIYRIERATGDRWLYVRDVVFGSFLNHDGGKYRVWAHPKNGDEFRLIGEVTVAPESGIAPLYKPLIAGDWRTLLKPEKSGYYINDHTIFQDKTGVWRLLGITSKSDGDFNAEKYFAVGVSEKFPPDSGMRETDPIADFGELAWAPNVIRADSVYHLFWSPHKLHQMTSVDGVNWTDHRITIPKPYHKFFRDAMVLQVDTNQWLLYTTARGRYFSEIDIYQSFNLENWQYIGKALDSSWGSERNAIFSSMESPFVVDYQNRFYLSLTYNNDSFFWPGILMLFHIWPDRASYNDTKVFQADNPYDFGIYRGENNSPSLVTNLTTHGPEIIHNPESDEWYITTAGWPWMASITSGEVAIAPLRWEFQK